MEMVSFFFFTVLIYLDKKYKTINISLVLLDVVDHVNKQFKQEKEFQKFWK